LLLLQRGLLLHNQLLLLLALRLQYMWHLYYQLQLTSSDVAAEVGSATTTAVAVAEFPSLSPGLSSSLFTLSGASR
jgi:hypothetical protein